MDISLIFDALILAVLMYISFKLYAISRSLSQFLERVSRERDSREQSPSGQTINVNVAPVPGSAGGIPTGSVSVLPRAVESSAVAGAAQSERVAPSDEYNPGEPSALGGTETAKSEKKSAQSGPFAVKCSRCQAENSSYRTECFNCGNPL